MKSHSNVTNDAGGDGSGTVVAATSGVVSVATVPTVIPKTMTITSSSEQLKVSFACVFLFSFIHQWIR